MTAPCVAIWRASILEVLRARAPRGDESYMQAQSNKGALTQGFGVARDDPLAACGCVDILRASQVAREPRVTGVGGAREGETR